MPTETKTTKHWFIEEGKESWGPFSSEQEATRVAESIIPHSKTYSIVEEA